MGLFDPDVEVGWEQSERGWAGEGWGGGRMGEKGWVWRTNGMSAVASSFEMHSEAMDCCSSV